MKIEIGKMKIKTSFLLIILGICSCSGNDSSEINENRFILNAVIRQLFELFRNLILNGSEENGVPVLDPYYIDNGSFDISEEFLSVELNITNAEFIGLGNFEMQDFNFTKNELFMEFQLNMPVLTFISDYYILNGTIMKIFPISGCGKIDFNIHNMTVLGKVYLKQSDDERSVIIGDVEYFHFNIERFTSDTIFDGNIDGIINQMIEDLLADYVNGINTIISTAYGPIGIQYLNSLLNQFETWKIISVILNTI